MTWFFDTDDSSTLAAQRAVLGLVLLAHGAQKLLGWFGGSGFDATMQFFTGTLGFPAAIAFLVIVAESFGALGVVLGAGTRLGALGIAAVMVGAVLTHLPHGFFMNWFGTQRGEGFEFHLLALALANPLAIRGGGRLSVDRCIAAWLRASDEARGTAKPLPAQTA